MYIPPTLCQVIKLYAWEIPFKQQIMGIRQEELNVLRSTAFLNAGSSFTWTCAPFLVSGTTFNLTELLVKSLTFRECSLHVLILYPRLDIS